MILPTSFRKQIRMFFVLSRALDKNNNNNNNNSESTFTDSKLTVFLPLFNLFVILVFLFSLLVKVALNNFIIINVFFSID